MFRHKYDRINKANGVAIPSAVTLSGAISTSDIGKLVGWTTGGTVETAGLPVGTTADWYRFIGILSGFAVPGNPANPASATATTAASTSVFITYNPIMPGEVIEADYSTTVARTAATNLMASSNIGKWFGIGGGTTTVVLGAYIDPSIASSAPGTTNGLFFKLLGFSSDADVCWGTINSSHLVI